MSAELGMAGVSLRQIAVAAGQRNPAVVQYHFGSKDDLLRATIESRVAAINERRLELMSGPRQTGDDELRRIVRGIVIPLDELAAGTHYVRFLANLAASPRALTEAFSRIDQRIGLSGRIVESALKDALAHQPEAIRELRISMMLRMVLHTLAMRHGHGDGSSDDGLTDERFIANLVEAAVGLLSAPVPD